MLIRHERRRLVEEEQDDDDDEDCDEADQERSASQEPEAAYVSYVREVQRATSSHREGGGRH